MYYNHNDLVDVRAQSNHSILEFNLKTIHRMAHTLRRKAPQNRIQLGRYMHKHPMVSYVINNAWHIERGLTHCSVPLHLIERFRQDILDLTYFQNVKELHEYAYVEHNIWALTFFHEQYDLPQQHSFTEKELIAINLILQHDVRARPFFLQYNLLLDYPFIVTPNEDWPNPYSLLVNDPDHTYSLTSEYSYNKAFPELYMTEWNEQRIHLFLTHLQDNVNYAIRFLSSPWHERVCLHLHEAHRVQYWSIIQSTLINHAQRLPPYRTFQSIVEGCIQNTHNILPLIRYAEHPDTRNGFKKTMRNDPFLANLFNGDYRMQIDLIHGLTLSLEQLKQWIFHQELPPVEHDDTMTEIMLY